MAQKKIVEFPPSVQDFLVIKHVPLNARVSGYLDFKFHNFPLLIKNTQNLLKVCKKGTNCEILSLNSRRLGNLKLYVI